MTASIAFGKSTQQTHCRPYNCRTLGLNMGLNFEPKTNNFEPRTRQPKILSLSVFLVGTKPKSLRRAKYHKGNDLGLRGMAKTKRQNSKPKRQPHVSFSHALRSLPLVVTLVFLVSLPIFAITFAIIAYKLCASLSLFKLVIVY